MRVRYHYQQLQVDIACCVLYKRLNAFPAIFDIFLTGHLYHTCTIYRGWVARRGVGRGGGQKKLKILAGLLAIHLPRWKDQNDKKPK